MQGLPSELTTTSTVFISLTKPILLLCQCKIFCTVIYLDHILVLSHFKHAGRRAHSFLQSIGLSWAVYYYVFKSELCLIQSFCLLGLVLDMVDMSVSLPTDKLLEIQQLALSFL